MLPLRHVSVLVSHLCLGLWYKSSLFQFGDRSLCKRLCFPIFLPPWLDLSVTQNVWIMKFNLMLFSSSSYSFLSQLTPNILLNASVSNTPKDPFSLGRTRNQGFTQIHSFISIQAEGRFWQEPEPSQATAMALAHCILGSFLGVGCHCFPPPLNIPTFASRCLHVQATWETSISERRNYGREMAGQFCLWFQLPRKSRFLWHAAQICDMERRLYAQTLHNWEECVSCATAPVLTGLTNILDTTQHSPPTLTIPD